MELAVVGGPTATASSKLLRGFWRWTMSFTSLDRLVQLRTVVELQIPEGGGEDTGVGELPEI
ncbi:hypothetical protein PVAP13_5NG553486 [Panicum virgatum]|uniref:Uncharacterized protein n=1 Tax=Panicum virgatum TaxID=38727 RepID=A0A8T0S327_PANVG|nr:hypothetical protein PVAP13_5NG553486 [Panicum virgatum]